MADDPYAVLGVTRGTSNDDIRRAYLKLVKELHPDVNPSAAAEERFKKISAAYDIVGDPQKRAQYDRGEIDASGEPIRRSYQYQRGAGAGRDYSFDETAGAGFGDFFSDLFSGSSRSGAWGREGFATRGRDLRYTMDVAFLEAATGAKKRVTLPEGGVLDLNVPAGVRDGQILRLKGKGAPGFGGGPPGDGLVEIKVGAHRFFTRAGDDIHLDIPITVDEAILGAKIEVPTLTGRVSLQIPKGTSSGKVFRMRAQGVKNAATGATGDQLVTVRIVLPDRIDDSLSYFMSEWRQKNRYDPGRP